MVRKILLAAGIMGSVAGVGYWNPISHWWAPKPESLHGIVEIQEIRLTSKLGGRVTEIFAAEGQQIPGGQIIAELDNKELVAKRRQLVAMRDAAVAVKMRIDNGPREKEKVASRYALEAGRSRLEKLRAGYQPEEIEQAEAMVASAKAELDRAQKQYDRDATLVPKAISLSVFEQAKEELARAQNQLVMRSAYLRLLKSGKRPEEISEAAADLGRLQTQLDLLESGNREEEKVEAEAKISELDARIEELDYLLRESVIRASDDSLLEVLTIRKGDYVQPGQPVARVLRSDDLWVKAYVPETRLGELALNQEVKLSIDSHPGQIFRGRVIHIATTSEYTPRNVQSIDERKFQVFAIKIRVVEHVEHFKSGMAVDVAW